MIHTPNSLKKLSTTQLKGIRAYFGKPGASHLTKFVNDSIKDMTEQMTEIRPNGTNEDYYQWGFRQGALGAHKIYRDMVDLIDLELKRREDLPANDLTADPEGDIL